MSGLEPAQCGSGSADRGPERPLVTVGHDAATSADLHADSRRPAKGPVAFGDETVTTGDVAVLELLASRFDVVIASRSISPGPRLQTICESGTRALSRALLGVSGTALVLGECDRLDALESGRPSSLLMLASRARRRELSVAEVQLAAVENSSASTCRESYRRAGEILRLWWNEVLHSPDSADAVHRDGSRGWGMLALLVGLAAFLLYTNLSHPLVEPDEGRHAEIAREMLSTGNWLVPHFNGDPYYDKPPLFYWLCGTSYRLFGVSEQSARLVPATAMLLTIIGAFLWSRRRFGVRAATLGTAALILSPGALYVGRFVVLDALLNLSILATLALAYEAVDGKRFRFSFWIASAVCCGLGVLTKGPVALALTLPPLVAFVWLDRRLAVPHLVHWIAFVGIAVSIAAPWYAAVMVRDPGYAHYFFWEHNAARFLSGANHPKPLWFYVPVLILACLPWSLLLIPLAGFLAGRSEQLCRQRRPGVGFLLQWAGWCVAFFTLSSGKLPTYVLPAVAPLCLLLGVHSERVLFGAHPVPFADFARRFVPRYGAAAICWTGIIVGIGLPYVGLADRRATLPMLLVWAGCLAGLAMVWWRIRPRAAYITCGILATVAVTYATHDLLPRWAEQRSLFGTRSQIDRALTDPEIGIGCWGNEWGAVPFYLERDDVENFEHGGLARVIQFMHRHDRAFLLLKGEFEQNGVRQHLPPGKTLTTVAEVGNPAMGAAAHATLFFLDDSTPTLPPDALQSATAPAEHRPDRL